MWYVIQTGAGNEQKITLECEKYALKNEEVFYPLIRYEKRVRGKNIEVTKSMFPGYIFFDTEDVDGLFFRLKKVFGFSKILKTGDFFTPISEEEENMINELAGDDHIVEISEGLKEDGKVRIISGPLKNFTGIIRHIDRRKRTATLEVMMLGEVREVKVGLRVMNPEGEDSEG